MREIEFMNQEGSKSSGSTENTIAEERSSPSETASADPTTDSAQAASPAEAERSIGRKTKGRRRALKAGAGIAALGVALYFTIPEAMRAFNTVSTDDAYVNGHVTFVAARVPGQVMKVSVDDNNMVRKGDLLVELDKEPYRVQVEMKQAELARAQADLSVVRHAHIQTGQD